MYPGGHPTLVPAAEGVARRLEGLLAERGTLSLGVARDQLVIEGVATDPRNPVLHDLAERLHRHHLGAVTFLRGVSGFELEQALKAVAEEAERTGEPIGLRPAADIPRWPHVQLFPLTFDRLELVGGPEDSAEDRKSSGGVTGGRPAQLWVGLARAAMAAEDIKKAAPAPAEPHAFRPNAPPKSEALSDAEIDAALGDIHAGEIVHAEAEPAAIARAIEGHERGTAYDQVIVGYMLQIADELKTTGGAGAVALKKRMSKLVTSLDENTLGRLVDMGGDLKQRRQFILDATQGMAADAVVDLVKAASGSGTPISNSMLRMLNKLSQHAERGPTERRKVADSALREQVSELVQGWALADPNPDAYATALQNIATAAPTFLAAEETAYAPESDRVVKMAIETGGVGGALERAMDDLINKGRMGEVLQLLEETTRTGAAVDRIRERIVDPAMLHSALESPVFDGPLVDKLVAALGPRAVEPMLDVLASSESRQLRRNIIDRVLRIPDALRPELAARAGDERWYVQRNVLFLAAELPGAPAVNAAPFRQHTDARVRREALRVLLKDPAERTRAICTALGDDDPRNQRLAVNAMTEGGCPDPAVAPLVTLASDLDAETELRVAAIRILGAKGDRLAIDALLRIAEVKRFSIIDMLSSSQASAEYLAAIAALAAHRAEPRVRERLETLTKSRDPGVVKAATQALKGAT